MEGARRSGGHVGEALVVGLKADINSEALLAENARPLPGGHLPTNRAFLPIDRLPERSRPPCTPLWSHIFISLPSSSPRPSATP